MKRTLLNAGFGTLTMAVIILLASFSKPLTPKHANSFSSSLGCVTTTLFKEFVITVNGINDKNFMEVRTAIESSGGIFYKGYCPDLNVLMYLVNREMHPENDFLDKLTALSFTYEVKEGASINDICNQCGMTPIPTPDNTNSNE